MNGKTIAVCGATGKQGGAVIESLLRRKQWNIVAFSRDPHSVKAKELEGRGVKIVKGDLMDKESLISAFDGVDYVFGVTQPFMTRNRKADPEAEVKQGRNIIDSCIKTRVGHLVLSTVFSTGYDTRRTGVEHLDSKLEIVEYLKKTSLPYTILKPASFMDNIGMGFFPVKKGHVRGFTDEDVKIPYIAVKDIGEFAALVFEQPELYRKKELNLVAELVSGGDIARILSKIRNGEPFRYTALLRIVMRLFAKELYQMRVAFEKSGRPPYPIEYLDSIRMCRGMHPHILTMEEYLLLQCYDVKKL